MPRLYGINVSFVLKFIMDLYKNKFRIESACLKDWDLSHKLKKKTNEMFFLFQ